jgi:anthranilate synthase component 1
VLFAAPRAALVLHSDGRLQADGFTAHGTSFLTALDNWWLAERAPATGRDTTASPADGHGALRFAGAWALYLAYELAGEIEPRLELPRTPLPWVAFAVRTQAALVYDFPSGRAFAVAEEGAADALEELLADATAVAREETGSIAVATRNSAGPLLGAVREEDPQAYLERVRRAKEYIRAGDIYQANLSRPWEVAIRDARAAQLYERLCAANPAPFAALAQRQGVAILSSSPERLVRVSGRRIDTRPIAGTRPRSGLPGGDAAEIPELVMHPKERAEHIMLVDLERNDLGRLCEAGTVRVDELMTIESYTHVHHIVSNVSGVLREDVTPIGALRAVFPGGTITGCPKFRCMQIIAELEGAGRGAYTGSLGYLTRAGDLDLNILIRTMTLSGQHLSFRAGAGIVADSDPQRELEETRAKARGLLAALGAM